MEFQRARRERPHIDIAPLVDIIFLLLIFFMVGASFIKPSIKMELPSAEQEEQSDKSSVIITADKEGHLFINKEHIDTGNLENALKEKMDTTGKYEVIFRGDKKIQYELFVSVLDKAKSAGALSFSVEHE